ncbi:hypothetical protein PSAB6_360028 [Paraburkholderia sabiae]|nr:hypothetical protein PSAB6_360028 [Paraburkholderia sabiae]
MTAKDAKARPLSNEFRPGLGPGLRRLRVQALRPTGALISDAARRTLCYRRAQALPESNTRKTLKSPGSLPLSLTEPFGC